MAEDRIPVVAGVGLGEVVVEVVMIMAPILGLLLHTAVIRVVAGSAQHRRGRDGGLGFGRVHWEALPLAMNLVDARVMVHHTWIDIGHQGDLTTITTLEREARGHLGLLSRALLQALDLDRQGEGDILSRCTST